jgi:TPR repeat protein
MRRIAIFLAAASLYAPAVLAQVANDCDRLAASPLDPDRPQAVPGVMFPAMNANAAVPACLAAAKTNAQDSRTLYQFGRSLRAAKKYDNARAAYKLADSLGSSAATVDLGQMAAQGVGGARDAEEARRLYEKAAGAGNPTAMALLAAMYENGSGVAKDPALARQWYARSSGAGIATAMNAVGLAYERGKPPDLVAAQRWYAKATQAGDKEAADNLQRLRNAAARKR